MIFLNENEIVWEITSKYNIAVSVSTLIPLTLIFLLIDSIIINRKYVLKNISYMALILLEYFLYIQIWFFCSGGV